MSVLLKDIVLFAAGNLHVCREAAVHLHAGEDGHGGPECPVRQEGLHTGPDHSGAGQHPQPVWEDHGQHSGQPHAGEHVGSGYVQA